MALWTEKVFKSEVVEKSPSHKREAVVVKDIAGYFIGRTRIIAGGRTEWSTYHGPRRKTVDKAMTDAKRQAENKG